MTSNKTPCLDKESILAAVLQLGVGGPALSLDGEFRGGECHVCKLSFIRDLVSQDRESLAVRVPLYMSGNDGIISALETEWQTLQILRAKGFAWSPRPLGCSLTFDNPVKHPFLVLTWGERSTPRWDDISPPRPLRDKFLTQLAAIQMCLIRSTLENGSMTWQGFFERIIENRRVRVLEGKIPGLSEKDCDDQKALLLRVLGSRKGYREMAMDHGDHKPENIIVDDAYNITCAYSVIDWAFAVIVPLPRAAGLPRFLWGPSLSPTAQKDRRSYVTSFASLDSHMQVFQTERDVAFSTLYMESLFSKNAHLLLAKNEWKVPGCELLGMSNGEEPSL